MPKSNRKVRRGYMPKYRMLRRSKRPPAAALALIVRQGRRGAADRIAAGAPAAGDANGLAALMETQCRTSQFPAVKLPVRASVPGLFAL